MTTATIEKPDQDFASGASTLPERAADYVELENAVRGRLDELSQLEVGWDGADARPVDRLALDHAWRLAEQSIRADLPAPELFPVPDGGVQLEWHAGPVELEVEIEPGARAVVFVCDDEQSGQQIDGELPEDASRFALALARLNAHR